MANAAGVLLDQLMGSHRNAVPGDNVKPLTWSDEDVCKFYLCGFCPCDLFTNTRADIGPCLKLHDNKLKEDYEKSGRKGNCGYETDFLHYLEKLIRDLDRRISRGKERLHRSAEAKQQVEGAEPSDQLRQLNSDINTAVMELEELGASGRVDEAKEQMMKLEKLERERETERLTLVSGVPKTLAGFELDSNDFHEKMELCDICGSFLVIGDTQARVDAHLLGKQHIGYARIRAAIKEIKSFQEERALTRRKERISESSPAVERKEKRSSPRRKSRSPRRRSKSPRRRSRSPRKRSRSPRKRSRSPRKRSRSPRRRSRSPRRRSPQRRSKSPQRRSRSPRKRSRSPRKRSRSPRKRSRSPRKRSRSPRKRSRSPRRRGKSPRRSRSPRRKSRSPRRTSDDNRLQDKNQSLSSNQDSSVPTCSVQTVNPDGKLEDRL